MRLYEHLGDADAQERAFRRAIDMNPRFAEGYFYLARLYLKQGRRFDDAISLAKRGLEVGPESEFAPLGHYVLNTIVAGGRNGPRQRGGHPHPTTRRAFSDGGMTARDPACGTQTPGVRPEI